LELRDFFLSYSGTDFTDETGPGYMAKKEEMPVMEQKPGRYWGVIGRQHLPGIFEQESSELFRQHIF
jgi:hypothetical protein